MMKALVSLAKRIFDLVVLLCSAVDSAPAGHIEDRSRHIGGFVGKQPKDRRRNLFGSSAAFHGNQSLHPVHALRLTALGMNVSVDKARPHGIYTDTFFSHLAGKANSETVNGSFASCIVDILSRCSIE